MHEGCCIGCALRFSDMDDHIAICRKYNLLRWNVSFGYWSTRVAHLYSNFLWLHSASDQMSDRVLLKHVLICKCTHPALENPDRIQPVLAKQGPPEPLEVGAVAEAPWGNRNHLTTNREQS